MEKPLLKRVMCHDTSGFVHFSLYQLFVPVKCGFCWTWLVYTVKKADVLWLYLSCIVRKPVIFICQSKGSDKLRHNSTTDQGLCFHLKDNPSTF